MRSLRFAIVGLALVGGLLVLAATDDKARSKSTDAARKLVPHEQVTIFGIELTSDPKTIDPKLVRFENELRKFKPGHGFKLLDVKSQRLGPKESLTCDMGGGVEATTELLGVDKETGKLQFKFALVVDGRTELAAKVTTPPNQLFYCEKKLPNGERLLIGIGAR
jgi:hypothetical protein